MTRHPMTVRLRDDEGYTFTGQRIRPNRHVEFGEMKPIRDVGRLVGWSSFWFLMLVLLVLVMAGFAWAEQGIQPIIHTDALGTWLTCQTMSQPVKPVPCVYSYKSATTQCVGMICAHRPVVASKPGSKP